VVAKIFSYFGDNDDVSIIMQNLSHKTRAYFVNADGLKGFLQDGPVRQLSDAKVTGKLKYLMRHQHIEL